MLNVAEGVSAVIDKPSRNQLPIIMQSKNNMATREYSDRKLSRQVIILRSEFDMLLWKTNPDETLDLLQVDLGNDETNIWKK